jgi:hypothetical protein
MLAFAKNEIIAKYPLCLMEPSLPLARINLKALGLSERRGGEK